MLEGHVHQDFWAVARLLGKQVRRSGGGGAAVCVYHRGECVVDVWAGSRDGEGTPWTADTLALSYSTTKGVTATLLHVLVDRGLLDYDDRVADYWPEFAQSRKERITVRHLLSHSAGLYDVRSMVDHGNRMLDWEYMTEALAESSPAHEPGVRHAYHGFTFGWLVGELIQRVSGKPFAALLESEIAEPLDLDGLYVGLPEDQMHRRATLKLARAATESSTLDRIRPLGRGLNRALRFARIPVDLSRVQAALMPHGIEEVDFNSDAFARVPIPAANGMFTARSLAKLYAVLAGGGAMNGVRLLSEGTLRRATEVQTRAIDGVVPFPMHWRLGYHRANTIGVRMKNAFGHAGFGGSGGWADPDRNLAVAMVLNSGVGTPFGDLRIVRIGSAAARCADRR